MSIDDTLRTNLDISKIRASLRRLAEELTVLKKELRKPWSRPMAPEQAQFLRLRWDATWLHCLLAWGRGKSHLKDNESCRIRALKLAPKYQKAAVAAA